MTPEERAAALNVGLCRIDAIRGSSATTAFIKKELAREIREAIAEEREACVALLEGLVRQYAKDDEHICPDVVSDVIAAIRTRS